MRRDTRRDIKGENAGQNYFEYGHISRNDKFQILPNVKGVLSGVRQSLATDSPLKLMKKCSLFHLKSSIHSQDNFCLDLSVERKNGSVRKIR